MASDLEDFADSLLIEGRIYNEHDQDLFRERTETAKQSDVTEIQTNLTSVTERVTVVENDVSALGVTVNGIAVGVTHTVENQADLPATVNGSAIAIFGVVYKDSVSPDNNGTYYQDPGVSTWVKVPGDLTGRVVNLESDNAKVIKPSQESITEKAIIHFDQNRREFMSHRFDGTTSLRLNADSIPTISYSNLDASLKESFPIIDDYNGIAVLHRDSNGRLFMSWGHNGKTNLILENGTVTTSSIADGSVTLVKFAPDVQSVLPLIDDYNDYSFIARDENHRDLWKVKNDGTFVAKIAGVVGLPEVIAEVTTARGTTPSLNARLSTVITPAGLLNRHRWGEDLLRSFGWKRTRLENAVIPTNVTIMNIGDSWTQARHRLSQPTRRQLSLDLGGNSGGWYGFGIFSGNTLNGAADLDILTGSRSNDWTDQTTGGIYAVDGKQVTGVVAGSWIQVNFIVKQSRCRIHYRNQPGGGSFRWRINNDGAWTTVSTDVASSYGLVDIPLNVSIDYNIRIEVVEPGTNGVIMNGLDTSVGDGVIVHKCGLSGGTCANWSMHTVQSHFVEGIRLLNPDLVSIMFATNEQNTNVSPATLAANMTTLISWVRQGVPLTDIILMCPATNGLVGKTWRMDEYRDAIYGAAVTAGAAFLDYTKVFGDYNLYKYTGDNTSRNLFDNSDIHPSIDGSAVLFDAFYRLLHNI